MMEFGDKEWFKEVEKDASFPSDFAFYVSTDRNVLSTCLNSNTKNIGNIKYKDVNLWSDSALIEVVNCKTSKDYFEIAKKLRERWQ